MLQANNVSKSFGQVKAVNNVTFSVEKQKITSLIGPNGAGKTSLFNLISGLLMPDEGSLFLNGKEITGYDLEKKAQHGIGRMFQDPHCFPELTTFENVVMGTFRETRLLDRMKAVKKANFDRIEDCLEAVGLRDKKHAQAKTLTFGERRLLNIAQLLAAEMDIFLLDEPTVGLDDQAIHQLGEVIVSLAKERQKTVILIEHHYDLVASISDKVLFMVQGELLISGSVQEIEQSEELRKLYLG